MTLINRKAQELHRKLASLDSEFERWEKASAKDGEYQRHHSQISGVLVPLKVLRNRIAGGLQNKSGDAYLAEARRATQLILGIHRIWEFFRQKLIQRNDPEKRLFLEIADEFAWQCYAPVIRKTRIRRPPLIYLNGGASPFILKRNQRFEVESSAGDSVTDGYFQDILKQLPFPVIGVPWHQLHYWPEMGVIAHEVGHAVERDLQLEKNLDRLIEAAVGRNSPQLRYWKAWRSELFADSYGCAAIGPAFVSSLADFLVNSKAALEEVAPSTQSNYPPTVLRISFNQQILKKSGLDPQVADWDYVPRGRLAPFVDQAGEVATKFYSCTKTLLKFSDRNWGAARERAKRAFSGRETNTHDLRVILASIRCAFEQSPEAWDQRASPATPSPLDRIRADIEPLVANKMRGGFGKISKVPQDVDKLAADNIYRILLAEIED